MSLIYAYRNRLSREITAMVFLPQRDPVHAHPFVTNYFVGLGDDYEVIAMDGDEVAARAVELGEGIISTFEQEYEIGAPAEVHDLADYPRRDVLEREAKRKVG